MRLIAGASVRPALVFGLACLCGCAEGGNGSAGPPVRDSAGIRIVDNVAPAWTSGEAWEIGDIRVRIGGDERVEGQQLHRVAGAVRLSDGSIVIANAGSNELRFYEPDGAWRTSVGRNGEGPGNFRVLSWLGRMTGDSLLTWDWRLNRVTVFASDGRYVRDFRPGSPNDSIIPVVRGSLGDGRLLLSRGPGFSPVAGEAGIQRQPLMLWLVSTTGRIEHEFASLPGESVELRPGARPGTIIRAEVPFGATTLVAAGAERVHTTDNGGYDIHVHQTDGALRQVVRRPHEPLALRPEDVAADIEARLSSLPPVEEIRAGLRALYAAVPVPEIMPALRSMRIDTEGCIWIEAGRHMDEAVTTWSVFDRAGIWLGDVALDARLEPLEIGPDYLLVRSTSDLDVESVSLIELRRGR